MPLPQLTEEQRKAALEKAAEARKARAEIKQKIKAGDYAGAIEKFREAVRLAPENPQAHYQLALALRHTGNVAEARTHLAEARKLAPYLRAPGDEKP